ncbi:Spc7 kinetochore protein-domain-containing protein [Epithele typhae]|uniref:Spc7 kinetochore protein-domain-containing protein n=1 Tax=Epithele typhae TaxID=378194 RepID=UPI002007BAEA|nr:Spc7 kinetochore protein-domain-containing protein [Epithele typhae]KAH9912257.1 Spc7 kinetochore protein-domain-containing protein [Epithele typhae]
MPVETSKKNSPHRRRSLAVLGHGPSKPSHRRRAYSIAPGERVSPAAKARRLLVPRKSILKASINLPNSRVSDAAEPVASAGADDQTMDLTEVHGRGPRKSILSRRVSFAAHTHVRLFHPESNKGDPPSSPPAESPSPQAPAVTFITREDNDENAVPGQANRRSSMRRRSSGAFSEFGEQSMDMDMDDTVPLPQDFLPPSSPLVEDTTVEDEEFTEDEDESDMEVTEAIARNIERKRSLSLGPNGASRASRRRSSIMTASQSQSENQPPMDSDPPDVQEGESMAEDLTTSSAHEGTSFMSEGSSVGPVEYTIPPKEPDPVWLQLRAMTHAGNEPYEPPPPESDDDALLIQPSPGSQEALAQEGQDEDGEVDMDLTSAVAPPSFSAPAEDSFSDDGGQQLRDDTFSTENSFGDTSADLDNRTINLTQRVQDGVVRLPAAARADESTPTAPKTQPSTIEPLKGSVFGAPNPSLSSNVFGAVFSAPPNVFSAPTNGQPPSKASNDRPHSPSKSPGPATAPKPFTFALPRAGSPAKSQTPARTFALPSVPKSPKRTSTENQGTPASTSRPSVGRLDVSRTAAFDGAAEPSQRSSMSLRRPSGYFAQRKSLGAGVLPPSQISERASGPEKVSGGAGLNRPRAGLGLPPRRTSNGPEHVDTGDPLYPDLSQIEEEQESLTATILAPQPDKGKARATEAQAEPPASDRIYPRLDSPDAPPSQPEAVPEPRRAASPAQVRPPRKSVTHIAPPSRPVIDVSMAVDTEEPPDPEGPGVSQAWREGIAEEPMQEDDEPTISIEQFFQMTGIRFMDELTMPRPRRSTVGPGQLRPRRRRRSSAAEELGESVAEEDPIPLAEFAIAMAVDMPRIDLYTAITRDLTAYIQECKKIYSEAEEEALKDTPSLFREFANVDESEQAMLIHQLKLIKANNIGTAKSQWYDWKQQWVAQLSESASLGFSNLESDATYLAGIIKEAQDILPALRQEYEEVTRLLEQEQADVDEIENSDNDYLNELKASIAEQNNEIEAFKGDVSEAKAKLERLEEKLADINAQKEDATTAINQAKQIAHFQKESTSVEVFRLKAELEAMEDLHLWHAVKLTPTVAEFVYASKFRVVVPCVAHRPILARVEVHRTEGSKLKDRDPFPALTQLTLKTSRSLVADADEKLDLKRILERLGDFWSSCAQFRSQLNFLAIKYPLKVEIVSDEQGQDYLQATATVIFPNVKGKAYISFLLDRDTYTRWPLSVRGLKSHVEVAYGNIQGDAVLQAILSRLMQVSPADSHGCLLDACIEGSEQYE